ncbi:hypothetical protein Pan241w_46510 [Gimesia alba]|uniref:Uncharacterized protein n=1 Tax=Gimesia alba TaxID=2527973 RepID=A0A517RL22_9PLAN|nr:hypothetical protein [Gimesia alba]QDT44539.1 hypothetical protein Pan241w_46510 [Gimesia alba]
MGRKKKVVFPAAGEAFAFQLDDGRYSVCRVLSDGVNQIDTKVEAVLIACSTWIGSEVPSADNPELRPILKLTHHAWNNRAEMGWVTEAVPDSFIPIGTIEPTDEEAAIHCTGYTSWESMRIQSLKQWRWDHDREAVLAEDAIKEQEEAEQSAQDENEHQGYLEQVKLQDLAKHTFFPHWEHVPKKTLEASRKIMLDAINELIALGESASEEARLEVLENCIEAFNALDAEHNFIETLEREDICDEFEAIVHACGLGALDSPDEPLVDEWREW